LRPKPSTKANFFPDARFVLRWARPMLVVLGAVVAAWILFPTSAFNFSERYSLPPLSFVLLMALVCSSVTAQIIRFASNAGSVLNGLVRRPQPAAIVVHAAALLLTNQYIPLTVIVTVPTPVPAALVMV
jgi:hypothetical protein